MLSVLIPVYNFDVRTLVRTLHEQCTRSGIPFEILAYDDASTDDSAAINRELDQLPHVTFHELEENYGRSRIRNRLANDAQFEQLLYMDCDSEVPSEQFIQRYLDAAGPDHLVYGGRTYHPTPPEDKALMLRWRYGVEREIISVKTRQEAPYHSFMTNNFLVPKSIYQSIKLNEELKGYGHEDTLFGLALKEKGISIVHIDNPLVHIGLEDSIEFLEKTEQGIKNLYFLIEKDLIGPEVKLYRAFRMVKRLGLGGFIRRRFKRNEAKLLLKLHSANPDLRDFDHFKLAKLLEIAHQRNLP